MRRLLPILAVLTALAVLPGCTPGKVYGYHGYMKGTDTSTTVSIVNSPLISASVNETAVFINDLRACEINGETLSAVDAEYALVDPSAGTLTDGSGLWDKVFTPAKIGAFTLNAAIAGTSTVVHIPLHVYPALGLNAGATWGTGTSYNFDSDDTVADITIDPSSGTVTFPGGIRGIQYMPGTPTMTLITEAPTGGYTTTSLLRTGFTEDAYVLQTTNGRFVKLRFYLSGTTGNYGLKFIYLIADSSGAFAY